MPRDYKVFLKDILEAIDRIESYTEDLSFEDFSEQQLIQDAAVRNLEVIGEAVKQLPEELKKETSQFGMEENCWSKRHIDS